MVGERGGDSGTEEGIVGHGRGDSDREEGKGWWEREDGMERDMRMLFNTSNTFKVRLTKQLTNQ